MVQIDVLYEGTLRCRATHGPSLNEVITDAPLDNHGKGESFSPTDLVATALGSCMLTIMGIAAEKRGWNLEGSSVRVTKHMAAAPTRRIGKLEVEFEVFGDFDEKGREVLERAALTCPVHASLHPDVEIPVRFTWSA